MQSLFGRHFSGHFTGQTEFQGFWLETSFHLSYAVFVNATLNAMLNVSSYVICATIKCPNPMSNVQSAHTPDDFWLLNSRYHFGSTASLTKFFFPSQFSILSTCGPLNTIIFYILFYIVFCLFCIRIQLNLSCVCRYKSLLTFVPNQKNCPI